MNDNTNNTRHRFKNGEIVPYFTDIRGRFMVKVKLHYYNFWKQMRKLSHIVFKEEPVGKRVPLDTPLAQEFYAWFKLYVENSGQLELDDICTLRRMFYASKEN